MSVWRTSLSSPAERVERIDLEVHGVDTVDSGVVISRNVESLHVHDDAATLVQKESALNPFANHI